MSGRCCGCRAGSIDRSVVDGCGSSVASCGSSTGFRNLHADVLWPHMILVDFTPLCVFNIRVKKPLGALVGGWCAAGNEECQKLILLWSNNLGEFQKLKLISDTDHKRGEEGNDFWQKTHKKSCTLRGGGCRRNVRKCISKEWSEWAIEVPL